MPKIPNSSEIENLLKEFRTPLRVIKHSKKVVAVCEFLAVKISKNGIPVNLPLLRAAADLHDIVRVVDFRAFEENDEFLKKLREKYEGIHHAVAGAEILAQKGYPEIAKLVKAHRFLQIEEGFDSIEEKILYYADKRVEHDKLVSLKERLTKGRNRNAPETVGMESTIKLDQKVFALEAEICKMAGIDASQIRV